VRSVELLEPREGLRLFVTPLPAVRGRIVWDDGMPVDRPYVDATLTFGIGDRSVGASAGADGRFAVPLQVQGSAAETARVPPKLIRVRVRARHADATGDAHRTVLAVELGPGNDIGDLVLERAVATHVLVLDQHGAPVGGALVESTSPQRTDADGRAVVRAEPSKVGVRCIGAPGAR